MQETRVGSMGQEDPLEEEMATHSSILAWKNAMDRGAWWATVGGGHKELDTTERTHTHTHIHTHTSIHIHIFFYYVKFFLCIYIF